MLVSGIMTYSAANNRLSAAPQELLYAVSVPFQRIAVLLDNGFSGFWQKVSDIEAIAKENQDLKQQMADLRNTIVDYDKIKYENETYKNAMQMEEQNKEFTQVLASVIARDPLDKFYSFTIDRGRNYDIKPDDVVYSPDGLVGKVIEVGPNYSKVITILDPRVNVGCTISRTREIGTGVGMAEFAQEGNLQLLYLPRETMATENDLVVTTGYGEVFPADLIVGTVRDIKLDNSGKSNYAVVKPTANIDSVTMVFVITDFEKQSIQE